MSTLTLVFLFGVLGALLLAGLAVVLENVLIAIGAVLLFICSLIGAGVSDSHYQDEQWCTGHMEYGVSSNEVVTFHTPEGTDQRLVLKDKVCGVMVP